MLSSPTSPAPRPTGQAVGLDASWKGDRVPQTLDAMARTRGGWSAATWYGRPRLRRAHGPPFERGSSGRGGPRLADGLRRPSWLVNTLPRSRGRAGGADRAEGTPLSVGFASCARR